MRSILMVEEVIFKCEWHSVSYNRNWNSSECTAIVWKLRLANTRASITHLDDVGR